MGVRRDERETERRWENERYTKGSSGVSDNDIGSIDIIWKYSMGGYAAEDREEKMCPSRSATASRMRKRPRHR